MGIQQNIITANDNTPGQFKLPRPKPMNNHMLGLNKLNKTPLNTANIPDLMQTVNRESEHGSQKSLHLTLGCWAAAILFMITTIGLGMGTGAKLFSSIALLWTGLWSSYITADHGHWRLSEISVVTSLIGLMGAVIISATYFDLGLTLADGLLLMSVLPLIISSLLKSRISILASICASLILGALSFSGLIETSQLMLAVPLICAAQMYMGTKIRSGLAVMMAILTSYYWFLGIIVTAWLADSLPLTFASATLFILGAAHHRSGKAAEDKRLTGSSAHIYIGWFAAMIGAIGFQYFWLSPEALRSSTATLSISGFTVWKVVTAASLVAIFCSAIVRYKHSQISLFGIFLLTAVSAIIPMMLWFPVWTEKFANAVPGASLMPTVGIFIGASVTATAAGMCLNGVRRHSNIMVGMGIVVLFAQAYMLLKPELLTIDNSVIFITSLLTALAIGAVIAGTSLSHQAPAPKFKHA